MNEIFDEKLAFSRKGGNPDMKAHKKSILKKIRQNIPFYLMILPGLLYLFINNYLPLPGLQLAFKRLNYAEGIWGSPWVGLKNFVYLFRSPDSWIIIRNTLLYNAAFISLGTVFSVTIAILLNECSRKWQKRYQTFILIPHLLSYVVVSYIVYAFLGGENGMINNQIFRPLGLSAVSWYTEDKHWPFILVFVNIWKTFGYSSIIYFASIIGIDRTYYEAAQVDGASPLKQIWSITLPLLKPVLITMILLSIGRILYSDFGLFYQVPMNSGMLFDTTNTIDTFVYRGLLESNDVGRAAAANFIQSVLGFVLVLTANMIIRKTEKEHALF